MKALAAAFAVLSLAAVQDAPPPAGLRILGTATFQTPSEIQCLAFAPDGRRLAVGTQQDGILVWDLETSKVVDRIPVRGGVADLRYLSDGRRLVFMTMMNLTERDGVDGTAVWDLRDRKELFRFPTPNHYGTFEVSPDEKLLLTGEQKDHRPLPGVLAWELDGGKPVPGLEEVARHPPQVQYRVSSLKFTADGSRIACVDSWSGAQGNVKYDRRDRITIWEFKSGKLLHEWIASDNLVGWRGGLHWLHGDTQLLVTSTQRTSVVNAADGVVVRSFDGPGALSLDRTLVHCYGANAMTTYDVATGEKRNSIPLSTLKHVGNARLSRDGRWFAGSAMGQTPVIVDLQNRRAVAPAGEGLCR